MQTKITGIDHLDRYNFQRGFIDYLPEDESGINAFLMTRKKIHEEHQKKKQMELEKRDNKRNRKDSKVKLNGSRSKNGACCHFFVIQLSK